MIRNQEIIKLMSAHRGLGSSEQCYDVMYSIVRAFQVKSILEIGTNLGYSTIALTQGVLDNNQVPVVTAIDLWNNYGLDMRGTKQLALNNFKKVGVEKYITVIDGDSIIKVPEFFAKTPKVDLCFIDGDHTLSGVRADYYNCKEHTDLILFHDALCGKEVMEFLKFVETDGFKVLVFPTEYIEKDSRDIGIALAQRIK